MRVKSQPHHIPYLLVDEKPRNGVILGVFFFCNCSLRSQFGIEISNQVEIFCFTQWKWTAQTLSEKSRKVKNGFLTPKRLFYRPGHLFFSEEKNNLLSGEEKWGELETRNTFYRSTKYFLYKHQLLIFFKNTYIKLEIFNILQWDLIIKNSKCISSFISFDISRICDDSQFPREYSNLSWWNKVLLFLLSFFASDFFFLSSPFLEKIEENFGRYNRDLDE